LQWDYERTGHQHQLNGGGYNLDVENIPATSARDEMRRHAAA
jgi:hypothetical protein